jgi:hypothetical protein
MMSPTRMTGSGASEKRMYSVAYRSNKNDQYHALLFSFGSGNCTIISLSL